ncbi:MAG: SDR family oxidoreductase [Verrucomicrobiota bacterium]
MDLELDGKVVIVTGGAAGIGAAIVRSFAAEGAHPVIIGRDPLAGEALAKELNSQGQLASYFECELTDESRLQSTVEEIAARYGHIDGLVNNAGVNDAVGAESSPQAFRESLEKNLVQSFSCMHHALHQLKSNQGFIINIGSKVAATGQGHASGYAASKGGINGLTREWALDLAEHGIRVNCVIPAEVMTPQYHTWIQKMDQPDAMLELITEHIPLQKRMTTTEEIADMVVFLASTRSSHTTGQIIYVDGGYTHFDRAYNR